MIPILSTIIDAVGGVVSSTVGRFVEDKDKAHALEVQLTSQLTSTVAELLSKELEAQRDVVVAEAQGESWLQRNWRPITMMALVGMVCVYWMGFTSRELDEPVILSILDIVQIGLGGYIGGRTAEKLADKGVEIFAARAAAVSAGEKAGGKR